MTKEELTAVEDMVNEYIFKSVDVDVKEMPKEEAIVGSNSFYLMKNMVML